MSKPKTVKKKKKTGKAKVAKKVEQRQEELTEEQIAKLVVDLEVFQDKFLSRIACTDKFEIIPTSDEEGNVLSQEQLALIKREVNRLGLTTIYAYDLGTGYTVLMCPQKDTKLLVGMISNGTEVH